MPIRRKKNRLNENKNMTDYKRQNRLVKNLFQKESDDE
jgi:hypothetical protein